MSSPTKTEDFVLLKLEDFSSYKLRFADGLHDLADVHFALTGGRDLLLPSETPDLNEVLIPATPAVLDAAGIQIAPALAETRRYQFTNAGELTAASIREYASDKRDLVRRNIVLTAQAATAMSRCLKSLHPDIHQALTNFDAVRFQTLKQHNHCHSLLLFLEEVATQGSSANGTAALFSLLQPDTYETATPDQFVRLFKDNGDRTRSLLCTAASPDSISIPQLQVTAFVTKLHPTRDRLFLDWFNSTYPSGRTDDFAAISHRWLLGKKSLTPDQIMAEDTEAASFSQSKFETEAHSFLAKFAANPKGPDRIASAIKAHPILRSVVAKVLAAPAKVPSFPAPSGNPLVPPILPPASVLPPRVCLTIDDRTGCGATFVPERPTYKWCKGCHKNHLALGLLAISSEPNVLLSGASLPLAYWDCAATYNITADLTLLHDVVPLAQPFEIGGCGTGIVATSSAKFSCLPPGYNIGYYCPSTTATLLSLGSLDRAGGTATIGSSSLHVYTSTGPTATFLDAATLLPNNLYPVSAGFLSTLRSSPSPPHHSFAAECYLFHANPLGHYTAEDRMRAAAIGELHAVYAHGCDSALATALDSGSIVTPLRLTSRDVAIHRVLELNCNPCTAAKMHNPAYPPSTNPPAPSIGNTISFDLEELAVPSLPGGHTHLLLAVEEKTGTIAVLPCMNKTAPVVFATAMQYINTDWKAHGHSTTITTSDPEPVFRSLIPRFGQAGITPSLMPPGQHAQRLERHEQELINKDTAVRASLPYYFPQSLDVHVKAAVAFTMSLLPNSSTTPATPYELRTNHRFAQHAQHGVMKIGTVCNVMEGDASMARHSKQHKQRLQVSPAAELGVCLGFCPSTPGAYNFLIGSGRIVPRRNFEIVDVIPFNFERRKLFPPVTIPPSLLPSAPVLPLPLAPPSLTIPHTRPLLHWKPTQPIHP
jgi:hypothetical protein